MLDRFGATFQSGSEQSLYEKLQEALDSPEGNPLAEEQMRYIRERYSYEAVVEKTWDVYLSAMGRAAER